MLLPEASLLLLIDDDTNDIAAFEKLIESIRLPYDYRVAHSISSAISLLDAYAFDTVICKAGTGDESLGELVAQVRVPVIVVLDEEIRAENMHEIPVSAFDCIVKDESGQFLAQLPRMIESALQHKRLQTMEQQQRNLAEALRDTALALNSSLQLDEVLERILTNVHRVVSHDRALILFVDDEEAYTVQHHGWSSSEAAVIDSLRVKISVFDHLNLMFHTQAPCMVTDVSSMPHLMEAPGISQPVAFLAAPICFESQVIGFIKLESLTASRFSARDAENLQAFSAQAALAIRNARHFGKVRNLAALEERQRIARDLHDSVTQTLFSATMMLDSVLRLWQRDPASIEKELLELRDLNHGALAEMRTLLLELRPDTIAEMRIIDLVQQLVATLQGRSRVVPHLSMQTHIELPADVRVVFFRVLQEALNNIVQHARAENIWIELSKKGSVIQLLIRDDGRGFDPQVVRPGHMGLSIMQERISAVGGHFQLTSAKASGTTIVLRWSEEKSNE